SRCGRPSPSRHSSTPPARMTGASGMASTSPIELITSTPADPAPSPAGEAEEPVDAVLAQGGDRVRHLDRADLAQLGLREAAGQQTQGGQAGSLRRFHVPG